jgi:transglutaminase-like putative cysteine protease
VSAAAVPGVPRVPPAPGTRARGGAGELVFAPGLARGMAFLALSSWGALHWMSMLQPAEPNRGWMVVGVGALAMFAMLAAGRLPGRRATLAATLAVIPLVALGLLAGRVADELLRPSFWGTLTAGISRGLADLPGVRVPYRGLDQWVRTVIPLGGSALVLVAALLAFWPRRNGRRGHPVAALIALVVLYVVPVVAMSFTDEFLRGAVFTLLMVAFLRLEKLRIPDVGGAAALALAATLVALALAPALDRPQPWWDYETWADQTSASKSTTLTWDHSYGALTWPRDGRELIRVKAQRPAYWKAENLDEFDGARWLHYGISEAGTELPANQRTIRTWTQTITVTMRNLRSDEFITAGYTFDVNLPHVPAIPTLDGSFDASRTLRRGDTYTARVYTPVATQDQMEHAGTRYPPDLSSDYRTISVPTPGNPVNVTFPAFGDKHGKLTATLPIGGNAGVGQTVSDELDNTPSLNRIWQLAQTFKEGSKTPADYVTRVLAYLADPTFTYSEVPPRSADTLQGFLFEAKQGYCQQYSGAMALLLRMGGIPARVATGFTTGATDDKTQENVVRDFDAHSWVEAFYPGWGWLTFDPTPADSPARSQPKDAQNIPTGGGNALASSGDLAALRTGPTSSGGGGAPWWRLPLEGIAGLGLLALVALLVRRRLRGGALPALLELERALRRTRRVPAPGTTLRALEQRFSATPDAAGYVRALRDARYGPAPARADGPTRAQRRGLRSELARGSGLAGRFRAWWALPPR